MAVPGGKRVTRRLSPVALTVAIAMIAITLAGAWGARTAVRDQESKLLRERTNEVGLVLTSAIGSLPQPLDVLGGVLRATHNSPSAFGESSRAAEVGLTGVTFALIRKTGAGYRVMMATGGGLHAGQIITDQRTLTFSRAIATSTLTPTAVIGSGAHRVLGFAIGPPVAPSGTVLYRQDSLGPVGAPREAATAPFSELDVVIYAAAAPNPADILAKTTNSLPLRGLVRTQPLTAGGVTWTLQASAVHPLVGETTENVPWVIVVGGLFLALLVALVIEAESRRRKSVTALYDSEHRVAETLQRSLLPILPTLRDLGLAARYLPGSAYQQIGGDWFDVFSLDDGRVGVVIGDVLGHDIAAAAAMSKLQASLRAYAWSGAPPSVVLDRLDGLLSTFEISELVTVFYGLLDPPGPAGDRRFTFANAGHLPPFIRRPDGRVDELSAANSLLLGAPTPRGTVRPQAETTLPTGSMLLLYTDGLVEVPGKSLTDSLVELQATVAAAPRDTSAEALCDLVLAEIRPDRLRDDIAVLAIALTPSQAASDLSPAVAVQ
jgi:serine phosphatase RsbU (regulator of sigma subunit)